MSRGNYSAYPETAYYDGQPTHMVGGLTIREHFAALAMQGCLAFTSEYRTPQMIAREAVMNADALIAELAKVTP